MISATFTLNKNTHLQKSKPVVRWRMGHQFIDTKLISNVKRPIGVFFSPCKVIAVNAKTIVVQLRDGNIVKRHKVKHEAALV